MIALVLAGGKGTRLGEATKNRPKPMVELNGKPLLEHTLEWLKNQGVSKAILTLNYLPEVIQTHFKNGGGRYPAIDYIVEDSPMGTAGILSEMSMSFAEPVWVVYGDVFMDVNLSRIWEFHNEKNADMTLVVHPNDHPYDSDLTEVDANGKVQHFYPKPRTGNPWLPNLVNAGLYLMNPKLLDEIPNEPCDFGRDLLPNWVQRFSVFGYNTPEYMKDMGTPHRLQKVEFDLVRGFTKSRNLAQPQAAIFLDRDGVINDDTHFISKAEDLFVFPFSAPAISAINRSGYLAIVATNQSVLARNMTSVDGLNRIHYRMETELGFEGAYLDAIYYCPHHPDKGFPEENPALKIDCDCRKPKPGMLLQASKRFNVDLRASFMIGDNERDIQAGSAAGCTTIGVATGKGLKSGQTKPDLFFANLNEAVEFILNPPFTPSIDQLAKRIHASTNSNSPIWIRIGGNTGSGKSSLASLLHRTFRLQNIPSQIVRLDDWILNAQQRRDIPHDWKTSFQVSKIASDLSALFAGQKIEAPGYARHPKHKAVAVPYGPALNGIVLVEGIPSFAPELDDLPWNLNLFIDQSETERKAHVHELYTWKGLNSLEVEQLYHERHHSEYLEVDSWKEKADVIILRSKPKE